MKKSLIGFLTAFVIVFNSLPLIVNGATTRENILQTLDTTGYGSYTKLYLNKTDSVYNPINTMAIVNTGKLHVKFNYKVTESDKGPFRAELRGFDGDADYVKEKVNPYWNGWQYTEGEKLTANQDYSFDAVLDSKSILPAGKKITDGPYLFFGGVGSTLVVTNLEIYAEGSYDEPVYSLNKMNLQEKSGMNIPGYSGSVYELTSSRWDTARKQHRIATYKNVYDFKEGTKYSVVFKYKTGTNGKTFNLDTCSDKAEATGWKNVGNYELSAGSDTWQNGALSFTCSSALAENDTLYLSYNLASESNDPQTDFLYITDMVLYEVPDEEVTYVSGSADANAIGGAEFTYKFSGDIDKVAFVNGFKLNGKNLETDDFEFLSGTTSKEIKIKIKKTLAPLSRVTVSLADCCDKYGREIEIPESLSFVFTVNPYISNKVTYYDVSTEALEESPVVITSLGSASKVRAEFTLTNNTAETKKCYIVNMVLSDGVVKKVYEPLQVTINSGAESAKVHRDIEVSNGDVIRSFYWSSTDKTLRAFNMYSEFK